MSPPYGLRFMPMMLRGVSASELFSSCLDCHANSTIPRPMRPKHASLLEFDEFMDAVAWGNGSVCDESGGKSIIGAGAHNETGYTGQHRTDCEKVDDHGAECLRTKGSTFEVEALGEVCKSVVGRKEDDIAKNG